MRNAPILSFNALNPFNTGCFGLSSGKSDHSQSVSVPRWLHRPHRTRRNRDFNILVYDSLCDFQELYRYLVDDLLVQYCRSLSNRDLVLKTEDCCGKRGKRQFLNDDKTRDLVSRLDKYFETEVSIPRIRRGSRQELKYNEGTSSSRIAKVDSPTQSASALVFRNIPLRFLGVYYFLVEWGRY